MELLSILFIGYAQRLSVKNIVFYCILYCVLYTLYYGFVYLFLSLDDFLF